MRIRYSLLLTGMLCLFAFAALAESRPMMKYQPGQKIDVGFSGDVRFMAGCEFDGGPAFMLVDTDFFDGYLLVDSPLYFYDSIGGGSVTQTRGGQEVRIMGEYNSQWRIVSADPGSYYIHIDDLR